MAHAHHHHDTEGGDAKLVWAVGVNLLLTVVQIIGGVIAGSLALVADALHNLNDAASLGIALIARRIARRPADELRTFGYRRAEIVGALINLTTLIIVGLYLVFEALMRFFERGPINGWIVVWIAGAALAVDAVTAALTFAMSRHSLNIKAAFLHNLSDAMASIAVIVAGTLIILFEWYWTDLAATLFISAYILWQGGAMMKETIHILMQGVPEGLDAAEIARTIETLDAVDEVHHIHVWQLDEHHRSLEAHVVIDESALPRMEATKLAVKDLLRDRYHIPHSTLEFETPQQREDERCAEHEHGDDSGHGHHDDHPRDHDDAHGCA